jgi:hypothetical protein
MARLIVCAESLACLQGFLVGVDWVNDSVVTLVSVDSSALRAVLEDRDAESDRCALLGADGLAWLKEPPPPMP